MRLRRVAMSILPVAFLPFVACTGPGDSATSTPAAPVASSAPATTAAPVSPSATASAQPTASASAAAGGQERVTPLNQKFTDPETGDVIELIEVVRGASPEKAKSEIGRGGEVVLMKVRVTPGTQFGGVVGLNNFRLLADGDAKGATANYKEQLGQGRTAFDSAKRREGATVEGTVAWLARKKQDTYTFRYERPEAKIIGQDKTLPSFKQELQIS